MRARLLVALEALADGDFDLAVDVLDALLDDLERESESARLPAPSPYAGTGRRAGGEESSQ